MALAIHHTNIAPRSRLSTAPWQISRWKTGNQHLCEIHHSSFVLPPRHSIQIMSFSFSISDIPSAAQLARHVYTNFSCCRTASQEWELFSFEVNSLTTISSALEQRLSSDSEAPLQGISLLEPAVLNCRTTIQQVLEMLKRCCDVISKGSISIKDRHKDRGWQNMEIVRDQIDPFTETRSGTTNLKRICWEPEANSGSHTCPQRPAFPNSMLEHLLQRIRKALPLKISSLVVLLLPLFFAPSVGALAPGPVSTYDRVSWVQALRNTRTDLISVSSS